MAERICDPGRRAGRAEKARQFQLAAQVVEEFAGPEDDLADAYVTLCIHAGIAAADVICCARLGVHHEGQNHREAVDLLARVSRPLSRDLETLLGMKTRSGYSAAGSSTKDRKQARRAVDRLLDAAQQADSG